MLCGVTSTSSPGRNGSRGSNIDLIKKTAGLLGQENTNPAPADAKFI
jgi:hypothetical protein